MHRWLRLCLLILILTVSITSLAILVITFQAMKEGKQLSQLPLDPSMDAEWQKWLLHYNVTFETGSEARYRYSVWRKNRDTIIKHNAKTDRLYEMGLNPFSHLEHWEFVSLYLRSKKMDWETYDMDAYFEGNKTIKSNTSITDGDCHYGNFDWRKQFLDRKVRDQMSCGSCWAFSTAVAVEWHWAIHRGQSYLLSPQHLVDCVETNFGCNGGVIENALAYVQTQGMMLEKDYPYRSRVTRCKEDPKGVVLKIRGYETLSGLSEPALACVVKRVGPVIIGFDASGAGLQHYKSGIYDEVDCDGEMLNHGLVLLGFGIDDDDGTPYWICQNSFSDSWGENGYFRFKFGVNFCGVSSAPVIPII